MHRKIAARLERHSSNTKLKHACLTATLALAAAGFPSVACAQISAQEAEQLRQEINALRAEQQRSAQKIAELESALNNVSQASAAPTVVATHSSSRTDEGSSRLQLAGDLRLRYESNFGDKDGPNRDRAVLRARLRAAYAVNNWLSVGGQIATGDPDDPNTTDVTLTGFDDDLQVSLDQAYLRVKTGGLEVYGGKIPQPFMRTDLVWDGDVSPQGVSASYTLPLGSASLKATGLYFIVDEAVAGPNSDMVGGQLMFEASPSQFLNLELAAAYYDYTLRSTAGGDAGDFRSNRFVDGRYLSDYNLLDVIGAVTWSGMGEAWPVRITADYVKNFGAPSSQDSGFGVDAFLGRTSERGDWRFGYGYAETDVDAVLAAFSHDNTGIATNYRQHSLSIDYVPVKNVVLNATLYHYKPKDPSFADANAVDDWLDRLRLNFLINF